MTALTELTAKQTQTEPAELFNLNIPDSIQRQVATLPVVIEASELAQIKQNQNLLIVDVRSLEQCIDGHIPGAVMLEYSDLTMQREQATGLLPTVEKLSQVLSKIGLQRGRHLVAYNDDNGSHAARLLWTLEVIGHNEYSLLNGGFAAWDELDLPVVPEPYHPTPSDYYAAVQTHKLADLDYVIGTLDNSDTVLLDTRSPEEYHGEQVRAARGGHIPGAINFDWSLAVDLLNNGRLLGDDELVARLHRYGVTPDKEIIPYCHTHHRSAHTSLVLKHLGFPRVRAYAGSWSEWGNRPGTPVEL